MNQEIVLNKSLVADIGRYSENVALKGLKLSVIHGKFLMPPTINSITLQRAQCIFSQFRG